MDAEHARGAVLAFHNWCERYFHTATFRVVILDLFSRLHPKDKRYFRESRETRPGKTLEALGPEQSGALAALSEALTPVRPVLAEQAFIGGHASSCADSILFGHVQWARVMSPTQLLE
ncbi:MAG: hypothetical protein ACLPXB_10490 [Thiobacillaceae bacterium]